MAVAVAAALAASALVVPPPEGIGELGLQGFLDHLPNGQADRVAADVALLAALLDQLAEPLARAL